MVRSLRNGLNDLAYILLMEDDDDQRELLVDIIEMDNHEVCAVASASEAWDKLQDEPFDLVITDLLVRKDGEFIPDGGILLIGKMRIKGRVGPARRIERLPIIVVTGSDVALGNGHVNQMTTGIGADACLIKPIDPKILKQEITRLLRTSKA